MTGGVTAGRVAGAGAVALGVGAAGEAGSQKAEGKGLDGSKIALAGAANMLGTGVGAAVERVAAGMTTFVTKEATIVSTAGNEFTQTVSVAAPIGEATQAVMAEGAGGAASTAGQTGGVRTIDAQQAPPKCDPQNKCN